MIQARQLCYLFPTSSKLSFGYQIYCLCNSFTTFQHILEHREIGHYPTKSPRTYNTKPTPPLNDIERPQHLPNASPSTRCATPCDTNTSHAGTSAAMPGHKSASTSSRSRSCELGESLRVTTCTQSCALSVGTSQTPFMWNYQIHARLVNLRASSFRSQSRRLILVGARLKGLDRNLRGRNDDEGLRWRRRYGAPRVTDLQVGKEAWHICLHLVIMTSLAGLEACV